jgi:hypothetical protein
MMGLVLLTEAELRAAAGALYVCAQVCATCVGCGDARLTALRFQHVLVDECTQASEPEALIPLVLGAKQVGVKAAAQNQYSASPRLCSSPCFVHVAGWDGWSVSQQVCRVVLWGGS